MPLKQILELTAPEIGVKLTDAEEKALLVSKINTAAEELYGKTDLVGSLREQVFDIDEENNIMTFPYYVGIIRGVRHYNSACGRKIEDMRPRYFYGSWRQKYNTWRAKDYVSALSRELSQDGKLTFDLAEAEATDLNLYITGSTDTADRIVETLVVTAGDTSVETVNNFISYPEIRNLEKSRATLGNITITDAAGVQVSFIANCELRARHVIVQVNDIEEMSTSEDCQCYEILYKLRFTPFVNDYDEFPCEGYDNAIASMVLAHYYIGKQGEEKKSIAFFQAAKTIIRSREEDASKGKDVKMNFQPNRFIDSMEKHCDNPYIGNTGRHRYN